MDSRDLKLAKRSMAETASYAGAFRQETKTKEILKDYLTNYTTLSVGKHRITCILYMKKRIVSSLS